MENNSTILEDAVRIAVQQRLNNGESLLSIADQAKLDWGQLRRFLDSERELRSGAFSRLAIACGLELRPVKRR